VIAAAPTKDEAKRLEVLDSYGVLDTPAEPAFDNLTRLATSVVGTPISLVSLVDADRQWFKSSQGLPLTETHRDIAFCAHAIAADEPLIVEDATQDERFHDNPLVDTPEGIRSYAGVPIRASTDHALGTFCVIDRTQREFDQAQIDVLTSLARQVEIQLETRKVLRLSVSRAGTLRDRLIGSEEELRTSLDGVMSAHRHLSNTPLTTEQAVFLHHADHAAAHLAYQIDALTDRPGGDNAGSRCP
jgi:GAF domain-containing protein